MAGSGKQSNAGLSSQQRSVLTLAILIHFICVGVVLASNLRRSDLLVRLVDLFGVYTKTLNFDPDFIPYHYATKHDGMREGDDCFFEVDVYSNPSVPADRQDRKALAVFPQQESRYGEERKRIFSLARTMAMNVPPSGPGEREPTPEEDVAAAAIARGVAQRALLLEGGKRGVIRLVRRQGQPLDLSLLNEELPPDDPQAPEYQTAIYTADVWLTEEGETELVKRAISPALVAPLKAYPPLPAKPVEGVEAAPADKPESNTPPALPTGTSPADLLTPSSANPAATK